MSTDTLLGVIGAVLAVGSLVAALFTIPSRRRIIVLVVLMGAFIATSSITVIQRWKHMRRIEKVRHEVVSLLGHETWTAEKLYKELFLVSYDEVNEALVRGVEEGQIGQKRLELRAGDGQLLDVRAYFVRSTSPRRDSVGPSTRS